MEGDQDSCRSNTHWQKRLREGSTSFDLVLKLSASCSSFQTSHTKNLIRNDGILSPK